ncbi:LysR family transcriptional regulator [Novosphingobium nitrogenifigens]|uniref:LysR family transcriptional regulator n=1 Tax=Novosphingobium nitrogenifigens TaxID=378548 RepID=UPI00036D7539|nr:LysR family transcriptional regulator [Novosphingobium nitrogenifigens]
MIPTEIIPNGNELPSARRHLPPTGLLQAFEAVARLGSVTAAARELALTQSAVSRQIRALEDMVGRDLFVRERQSLRLSPAGRTYAGEVRRALAILSAATLGCRVNPEGGVLTLAVLPTFGTRWLAPRLGRFGERHPGITLHLSTRLEPFDFARDPLDLAIHFGSGDDWPGAELVPLMAEQVVPVLAPALAAQLGLEVPLAPNDAIAALARAPLIGLASRPDGWGRWFAGHGGTAPVPGMVLDQFATAAQVAMAGLGVALMPVFLVADELASGALVVAGGLDPVDSAERYWLAFPPHRRDYPPLLAFRDWVLSEAA